MNQNSQQAKAKKQMRTAIGLTSARFPNSYPKATKKTTTKKGLR